MGWAPAARGFPTNCQLFYHAVLTSEKTFTNHKFRVGLHVMFGLNDRRISIQYPRWSAEGFGEAVELLIVGM